MILDFSRAIMDPEDFLSAFTTYEWNYFEMRIVYSYKM